MKSQLRFDDNLFERLCDVTSLELGFKTVRRNKGSAGADGVTIEAFAANLDEELGLLQKELCNWTYKPKPVKRVAIPKPSGGERLLGIPSVRDRVVQATLKSLIEPLFESKFSDNSYGFRPGRDQKQAVSKAQSIVSSGKEFVVDIDLEQFFDRICHDRLMHRLGLTIEDKSILKIIAKILRSGVLSNGIFSQTQSGSPQGGPLSPLLSNVVLDELDHELERRDLEFCRYADDCNIFVKSQKAADRVLASISKFIVGRLKLALNKQKSRAANSKDVKFLGFTILRRGVKISQQSIQRAMTRVRELTPRGSQLSVEQTVSAINQWYVGWSKYYELTRYPSQFLKIEAHIRRRLRSRIIGNLKRRRFLYRRLRSRGVGHRSARRVYSNDGRWALSRYSCVEKAFTNNWFQESLGLAIKSDQKLDHWLNVRRKVGLT